MSGVQESESFLYVRLAFRMFKRYWYIFAASVCVCLAAAMFLNWYLQPSYAVGSVILINEDQNNKQDPSEEFMKTFSIFSPESNIQGEILKMKSSALIYKALETIHSEVTYFIKDGIKNRELYQEAPFEVKLYTDHVQPINVKIHFIPLSSHKYKLVTESSNDPVQFYNHQKNKVEIVRPFSLKGEFNFNELIESDLMKFKIIYSKNSFTSFPKGSDFYFIINNLNSLVFAYQKEISIEQVAKEIPAASIKLAVTNPQKGIDFINALTDAYQDRNLEKKNFVAENTIQYLDTQLGIIEDSLNKTETNLQRFRSANKLMEIHSKADQIFRDANELENHKEELLAKEEYYKYIKDHLEKDKDGSELIVPSSMGVNDNVLAGLINDYIDLTAERNNLFQNKQNKSPYFNTLSVKISNLKTTISDNLNYLINTNQVQLASVNQRLNKENAKIKTLPKTQRKLVGIERKYRLNDDLYTYMLKKKEEAQIAKASNLPNNDILESAKLLSYQPVSPKKFINLAAALAMGILLPFGFLGARKLGDNSVNSFQMIASMTQLLSAGQIYSKKSKKQSASLIDAPRSATSESIRNVRTNIDHFLEGKNHKIILITSTKSGEGKSFVALNLAVSMAMLGKKTLLIDFDMRKPNLHIPLKTDNQTGISTILSGTSSIEHNVISTDIKNLDLISSGPLPSNPSELTGADMTPVLLNSLKEKYDYILIDTPPLGLVTEGYLLMKLSDLNLLVIRENVTPKKQLGSLLKELESRKINNLYWLYNDVDISDTFLSKEKDYFIN